MTFPGGYNHLYGCLHQGLGSKYGRFCDFRHLVPYGPQAPHQLSGAQGVLGSASLGSSARGHPVMVASDNTTVVSYI